MGLLTSDMVGDPFNIVHGYDFEILNTFKIALLRESIQLTQWHIQVRLVWVL